MGIKGSVCWQIELPVVKKKVTEIIILFLKPLYIVIHYVDVAFS